MCDCHFLYLTISLEHCPAIESFVLKLDIIKKCCPVIQPIGCVHVENLILQVLTV
jgi:hypothetical protein